MEICNTLGSMYILSKGYVNICNIDQKVKMLWMNTFPSVILHFFPVCILLSCSITVFSTLAILNFHYVRGMLTRFNFFEEKKNPEAHMCSEVVIAWESSVVITILVFFSDWVTGLGTKFLVSKPKPCAHGFWRSVLVELLFFFFLHTF